MIDEKWIVFDAKSVQVDRVTSTCTLFTLYLYKTIKYFIHGNKDEVVPIKYSERAVEVYYNAAIDVIIGAGHGYAR